MGIIAFIPARGGSKSIPLKNIRPFCGKPLIYWNLKALNDAPEIDRIVVATDSNDITSCVQEMKLEKVEIYHRKAENAQDQSSTEAVMLEFLDADQSVKDDDLFILTQITSPFTTSANFSEAIQLLQTGGYDSLLTCVRIKRFFWNADGTPKNYDYKARPRRQNFEGDFVENGAFYINKVSRIKQCQNRLSGKIGIYEMPEFTQFEIDEPHDWIIAEQLFKANVYASFNNPLISRIQKVKIVLSDVDGVLTSAGMYYSENGDELKKFNTRDGKGFELLRSAGFKTGLITSENTQIVSRRGLKLKLDYIYQGVTNKSKLDSIIEICEKEGLTLEQVAYIGDDVNCIEPLSAVGFPSCPNDAVLAVKSIAGVNILNSKGGEGALRELADLILNYSHVN